MINPITPKGYNKSDKALLHTLEMEGGLTVHQSAGSRTTMPVIRSTKGSVDPDTIEVHKKNSSYAVDGGSVCCFDSIIPFYEEKTSYMLDYGAIQTSKIPAIQVHEMDIFGHHKSTWDAEDPLTSQAVSAELELLVDATNEDVIPDYDAADIPDAGIVPMSTVTDAEVFGDLSLTTNTAVEGTGLILTSLRDAKMFKHTAEKLKSMTSVKRPITLTPQNPLYTSTVIKKVPESCQFIDDFVGFFKHISLGYKGYSHSVLNPNIATTNISHVYFKKEINFWEFNPWFDQRRM